VAFSNEPRLDGGYIVFRRLSGYMQFVNVGPSAEPSSQSSFIAIAGMNDPGLLPSK
jgi:hypothetical protein